METINIDHTICLVKVEIMWAKTLVFLKTSNRHLEYGQKQHKMKRVTHMNFLGFFFKNNWVAHTNIKLDIWCGLKIDEVHTNKVV